MLRLTIPSSYMSLPLRFESGVQPRENAPRVAFVDLVPIVADDDRRGLDVAPGVIVVVARFRIDATHRTDHLAGKQDVVDGDHLGQQIDAGLMVDTGIE